MVINMKYLIYTVLLCLFWIHGYLACDVHNQELMDLRWSYAKDEIREANERTIDMFGMCQNKEHQFWQIDK